MLVFELFTPFDIEMTNKLVHVGIARTRSHFDGESPCWLGMSMG